MLNSLNKYYYCLFSHKNFEQVVSGFPFPIINKKSNTRKINIGIPNQAIKKIHSKMSKRHTVCCVSFFFEILRGSWIYLRALVTFPPFEVEELVLLFGEELILETTRDSARFSAFKFSLSNFNLCNSLGGLQKEKKE